MNCPGHGTCTSSVINAASSNSFDLHCWKACGSSTLKCTSNNCHINCENYFSCGGINFQYGSAETFSLVCNDFGAGFTCGSLNIQPITDLSPGHLSVRCVGNHVCRFNTAVCPSDGSCFINCLGFGSCEGLMLTCPAGGDCELQFEGVSPGGVAYNSHITCEDNSNCHIMCTGSDPNRQDVCRQATFDCSSDSAQCNIECDTYFTCRQATITCGTSNCLACSGYQSCYQSSITLTGETASLNCSGPNHACSSSTITCTDNNDCTIHCTNSYSCASNTRINCPENGDCTIDCSGQGACSNARITCPTAGDCTVECSDLDSCRSAEITCPVGDYSCNVLCTDPLSCEGLSITNTHNLYLQCCGPVSCNGIGITPNSTECRDSLGTCVDDGTSSCKY